MFMVAGAVAVAAGAVAPVDAGGVDFADVGGVTGGSSVQPITPKTPKTRVAAKTVESTRLVMVDFPHALDHI
jgi:hypothetical protein